MGLKTKVKNDLWRVNWVVPFAKKYLADGRLSRAGKLRCIAACAAGKRVVRGAKPRSVAGDTLTLFERVEIEIDPSSAFVYSIDEGLTLAVPGNILSNFTVDALPLVNGTMDDAFAAARGDDAFGRASATMERALRALCSRTADAIEQSSLTDGEKALRIAMFREMFSRPAGTFREGLQRVLFLNQALWQTRHRLNGLGRLDKLLGGLYEADLAAGRIDGDGARALVADFLSCLHAHAEYKSDALMGDIGQIIILGGTEPDGSYFRNALTDLFLECQAASGFPDPKVYLRCSASIPGDLIDKAVAALRAGTGSPLLSNDDRVVPALEAAGFTHEQACSYCVSACWEPLVPGVSLGQNNMLAFDAGASVADALSALSADASYDDLLGAFDASLARRFREFLPQLDEFKWAEDPLVSLFYPSCVRARRDVSLGAPDSDYGVTVVGVGNAVDSLANARLLMEGGRTAGELAALIAGDFAGEESLLGQLASRKVYGTDDPEAIALARRLSDALDSASEGWRNRLGGGVRFGLSSPAYIMACGGTPADLSGRRAGDPYALHISNVHATPTELVNFAGALDYSGRRANGNVVDFFVAPSLLENQADKFAFFLMAALKVGFFEMQMNVMDAATLVDAKSRPERYPGLIVRVWGFSAYFAELPESYQDYLIERARESEAAA